MSVGGVMIATAGVLHHWLQPVQLEGESQQQKLQAGLIESMDTTCRGQGMTDVRILK